MEKNIRQLFVDFIENRCTPSQIEKVQELLNEDKYEQEWRAAMDEIECHLSENENKIYKINEEKLFERICSSALVNRKITNLYQWLSYAAILLLISTIGFLLIKKKQSEIITTVAKVKKVLPTSTKSAQHKWIKLPDGSSVQLNVNSQLEYPESFAGNETREVTLIGEGFFDIKHDSKHPFVIHTGKIKTTVLGTAFNIRAYKADLGVTVTVTRGRVMVQDEKKTLAILTPDQQLVWNKNSAPMKMNVNSQFATAWKNADLIMDDITLSAAAKLISERYGITVQFKNEKVKDCRFTAAFLNRNEIGQVLTVIREITGASLVLEGNVLVIEGKGC